MTARKLVTRQIEKLWGRETLPDPFINATASRKIGEIWFEDTEASTLPLLVKYIFTSERLSIQVHPNDAKATARGLPGGKEECWFVLDAEPGACLGLGTSEPLSSEELRAAALDGSIEALMTWRHVTPGDFVFIPAGTVHAIGAGISLVEIQQNVDVTYRLFDYGRPRALHLDDGVAVAHAEPFNGEISNVALLENADLLIEGDRPFTLKLRSYSAGETASLGATGLTWFVPLMGKGRVDGHAWEAGECWQLDASVGIDFDAKGRALIAIADSR